VSLPPATLPAFGVFVVAARHQNFAHAAEELGLTASAVSHHVRALEATLGVRLFRRHARGAMLTNEGRLLADSVSTALSDIDATATSLKRTPRNVSRLRVATLHSLNYCWILPRLKTFTEANPRVRVTFEAGLTLARFDSTGPDLAIRHGAGYWPGLTAHHLMDEDLFPAAAPSLSGARDLADAAAIARLPLVTDLANQGWPDWFRAAGVRAMTLPEMHTFNDSTDALRAAASGLGAVLARSRLAASYLRSGELVRLPGPALKARFGYYAVHPTHRRPSPAAAAFIQWLRHEATLDT
jgi:LysR family transcriptional regulator, glycine cleavage system transcriptional activator